MPRHVRLASLASSAPRRPIRALLRGAASGDQAACGALWNEYSPRLNRTFRHWMRNSPHCGADEEDLTLDSLDHVFRRARAGAYERVATRAGFWNKVRCVARHTFVSKCRRERRLKRGGSCRFVGVGFDLNGIPAPPPAEEDDAAVEQEFYDFLRLIHFRHPLFWPLVSLRELGMSVDQAAQALRQSRQAMYAQLTLMKEMWLEYAALSDAAKRARFEAEEPLRRKLFDEAVAQRNRDIEARKRAGLAQSHVTLPK